jgi:methyl-accepting chemotaxis protein
MTIRLKILLPVVAATVVTALVMGTLGIYGAKTVTVALSMLVLPALAFFVGLRVADGISKPLNAAVNMLQEIGRGHLGVRLNIKREDEIGIMAGALDTLADDMQNVVVRTMKDIAAGGLSAKIELKDRDDEISDALNKALESLKTIVEAMKKISEGDLDVRFEPKSGDDELACALNKTAEAMRQLIINDGGKVFDAAANKDLSQRLTGNYRGEFAKMKDNINAAMQNLDDAINHIAITVSQVSSSSYEISNGVQDFAECASEQASSLDEVSSSLEAMASMTKRNADNSNQAMILASEARSAANDGDASMKRMADAINQIKQSADNTAKIIKSIDDIAFQTNLLALNAAVEAARAGEAGKGFAVVAEEVRNLAMLSAEAAQNTANMIEESVKNADGGVKITEEVAKSLGRIVDRTGKVGDLISEIAAVSNEQARGIEQVNEAVLHMNKITQQNAANSEESASASEELSSQASELADEVHAFKLSAGVGRQSLRRGVPPQSKKQRFALAAPLTKSVKAVKSEEIIPLDYSELNEF